MDSNKKKNSILRSIAESIVPFDREKDTQMEIAMMVNWQINFVIYSSLNC